jgi:hypothetical protein
LTCEDVKRVLEQVFLSAADYQNIRSGNDRSLLPRRLENDYLNAGSKQFMSNRADAAVL